MCVLINIRDCVYVRPFTSEVQEGLSTFKKTFKLYIDTSGLPKACDWFTVHAKVTKGGGWSRPISPYTSWVDRVASVKSDLWKT